MKSTLASHLAFGSVTAALAAGATDGTLRLPDAEHRAFKTLVMPGGLGSTMKVLVLGKNVGTPGLRGLSAGTRVT